MPLISPSLGERDFGPGPAGAESRANQIYGFMGGFAPLAFVAVCLRLYTRWRFAKIGADDIAITVGLILYIGLIVATVYAVKYGLGLHIWDVPYNVTGVSMQKCGFTSQVLYPTSLGAVKLSIILFLLRTLPPSHFWKKPLYAFATWVVVEESAFTIGLFLQCRPIAFYWDKSLEGTCFNQPDFYYVDAALNMSTDLCILALPWLIFRKLNMPKRRKVELLMVCSVGVFTLIASAVRLPYLHELNISTDPTWQVVDVCIWSVAELGSAITLSSVPAIRPLLTHIFPHIVEPSSAGTGSKTNRTGQGASVPSRKGTNSKFSENDSISGTFPYVELDEMGEARRKGSRSASSQEYILANGAAGDGDTKTDFKVMSERDRR